VFGYLGGGPTPFAVTDPGSSFVLAFRALPIVLVMSALSSLLFHWRVLPAVVRGLSYVLEKSMRVGGVVALSTAANVLRRHGRGPLAHQALAVARVARRVVRDHGRRHGVDRGNGAVPVRTLLRNVVPDVVAHLLIASVLSAPAALVISFMMVPPEGAATGGELDLRSEATGSMDALTRGTLEGAQLMLNIVAMLVVFVALVTLGQPRAADSAPENDGLGPGAPRLAGGYSLVRGRQGGRPARDQDVLNELVATWTWRDTPTFRSAVAC
jgi:CNT family concentrative nucleoside transporter